MSIVAIINPVSGAGADPTVAERRSAAIRDEAQRRGLSAEIHLTRSGGHARDLATASAAANVDLVIVWGGDGTVNEVGGALIHSSTTLALIPAGSGNGLAGALGTPHEPAAALAIAFDGATRTIDAGMMAGRPFFNIAGIGFDARVARLFNERGVGRRGGWPYIIIGVREGCTYQGVEYSVDFDGDCRRVRALLIAFANGREYGMGACIAPLAELDDGLLDATVVEYLPMLARFWDARHLAMGAAHRAKSVTTRRVTRAVVESDSPMEFHVDGEVAVAANRIEVQILPAALKVRVAPSG
ncbi:MAG: diacylglycerol/lipid kinase family protein [Vicinamibacterales bacterium]